MRGVGLSAHSLNALKKLRKKFAAGWKELGFIRKRASTVQDALGRWALFVEYKVKAKEHDFRACVLKECKRDRRFQVHVAWD